MSTILFVYTHPASLNYSGQLPFMSPHKGIRTSQKLNIFYSKVIGKTMIQTNTPPLNPATNRKIHIQKIFIGFGGSRSIAKRILWTLKGSRSTRRAVGAGQREDSILIRSGCALP